MKQQTGLGWCVGATLVSYLGLGFRGVLSPLVRFRSRTTVQVLLFPDSAAYLNVPMGSPQSHPVLVSYHWPHLDPVWWAWGQLSCGRHDCSLISPLCENSWKTAFGSPSLSALPGGPDSSLNKSLGQPSNFQLDLK